ncbi:hypothetical protein NLJ89_g9200 [Agrocybe chaxingu]|uniref:Uncharacterized protein n=1 Tax=Agrocybe chaxingu TaxID=84603 RepID=A0A9W8JR86_9AGAR|nr:hypothetical protein NLJ89_g9200 [Agrocybe chaxingu]
MARDQLNADKISEKTAVSDSIVPTQVTPPSPVYQPKSKADDQTSSNAAVVQRSLGPTRPSSFTDLGSEESSLALAKREYQDKILGDGPW